MALIRTQLTAAIQPGDLFLNVVSTTGFPVVGAFPVGNSQPILVDNEFMFHVSTLSTTLIKVRHRGADGTVAKFHDVNSPVVTSSSPIDFPLTPTGESVLKPPFSPDVASYGSDGALLVPTKDAKALLTKVTAGAYTLLAPSFASNGAEFQVSSTTAAAHVITTVSLIDNGAAGSPFNTITFPAQPGASVSLIAQNGLWNVMGTNGAVSFA